MASNSALTADLLGLNLLSASFISCMFCEEAYIASKPSLKPACRRSDLPNGVVMSEKPKQRAELFTFSNSVANQQATGNVQHEAL